MPFAQLSQVRMHYYEHGHGPETVVLVHGFQMSARVWQLVQAALPPERYRTIAPNMRGAGETDAPADAADYGIDIFAADLGELVNTLGLRDFTLVGHSMGGGTVAQFAVDRPSLLKGLVLLDPIDPDGRAAESPAEIERGIDARLAARQAELACGGSGDGLLPADTGDAGPAAELQRQLAADVRAAPEQRLRGTMRSLFRLRLGKQVASLPMPVLLACGDADAIVPLPTLLATWAKYPPGTGLHVWHGVGHSPNVEIPERCASLLRRFIEVTIPSHAARSAN